MDVRYLTAEQVQFLHDEQIERYTPEEQIHVADWGALESACKRPNLTHYYDPQSDIFDLAASLGFGLVKNHAFANANKRTAAVSTHVFLMLNGYTLTFRQMEMAVLFEKVAKNEVDQQCIAENLAENARELTPDEIAQIQESGL